VWFYVYILKSLSTGRYYTGQTNDLEERIKRHNSGSEQYTSKEMPWELIWSKKFESRAEAMKQEGQIKKRGAKRFLDS